MLKAPGKFAAVEKTTDALMQDEQPPYWSAGYAAWNTGEGNFSYFRTPEADLQFYESPLSYTAQSLTPAVKIPVELASGKSIFTGREYADEIEVMQKNLAGRAAPTYETITSEKKPAEKARKILAGIGTSKTQTAKESQQASIEKFKKSRLRHESFSFEQMYQGWMEDQYASALSGIPEYLQALMNPYSQAI